MNSQLFDLTGKLLSCVVSSWLIFQYFDTRYLRVYRSKLLYPAIKTVCCIINLIVYLWNSPVINIGFWLLLVTLISRLYYDEKLHRGRYYFTNIAFIFAYAICESVGGILVNAIANIVGIQQNPVVLSFIYTIAGSTTAILLYYLILNRLFIGERTKKITVRQYTLYAVITAYALINIGEILFLVRHELSNRECIFLLVDAVFIILINLYLLNTLDTSEENRELKYKLALYERQSRDSYEYYRKQMESRRTVLSVIHDIKKHIRVMEELQQVKAPEEMQKYSEAFEEMVAPLLFNQYCDNAILNVIIDDKLDYCKKNHILFKIDIQEIEIGFMEPIDITTVFGNLLDNAVEACEKAEVKQMKLEILPFNGLIFVRLSNTFSGKIVWDGSGKPISNRGEQHGIGLENVEKVLKKYNGTIQLSVQENIFVAEIIISQP